MTNTSNMPIEATEMEFTKILAKNMSSRRILAGQVSIGADWVLNANWKF